MSTADIPDWTRLIDLVPLVSPGQDFPDWTVGVQAPTGSSISGPFLAVGEALPIPIHTVNISPSSGAWAISIGTSTPPLVSLQNSSNTQGDFLTFHFPAPAGTYDLVGVISKDTDKGIQTVSVDGTQIGTIDGYFGSQLWGGESITGWVISTSGDHTLTIAMNSKNGLSTGFKLLLLYMNIQRVA